MEIKARKYRFLVITLMVIIVPAGFYTKIYTGPLHGWVNNSLGGFFYEIFWCLAAAAVFPRVQPLRIAAWVFLVTSSLELMQLWHPPFLDYLRSGFIGRTILGTTFNWKDFPYYASGSLAGWYLLKLAVRLSSVNRRTSDPPSR